MTTGIVGTTARRIHTQQVHYLTKTVNFGDAGIAVGLLMGTIPANSVIVSTAIVVATVFNAATTNALVVGITQGGAEVVASADSAAGVLGLKTLVSATVGINAYAAVDQKIYVAYTQTGAAATTGKAYVTVMYVPMDA